ncbi:MAG TPA: alpha-ketoacid dehydrogenase subunit beta, partial [Rectinemataceae bacterium]|nr:alpha-ketoacid dehydrogenase subunit beta [Rectinemataceae bacterium]
MAVLNVVQAINLALRQELERNDRTVILGEDIGVDGGVFRVTEGLVEAFGPERVIDMPLAESGIVGAAIGMALGGLHPVAEIQFMGFLYSAFDQVVTHAARMRNRSRGRYSCPLVIRAPYGAGIRAPEMHEESSEAFFCHSPGLKVVVPSGPRSAKGLLTSAMRNADPVIFLEPTRLYRLAKEEVPEEDFTIPIGEASLLREGGSVTVIAWGSMLHRCLGALEDYDIDLIDLRTLSPFDEETVLSSARKTGRVVVVEEAPRTAGFGAELAATIAEDAMLHLRSPIFRVAGY